MARGCDRRVACRAEACRQHGKPITHRPLSGGVDARRVFGRVILKTKVHNLLVLGREEALARSVDTGVCSRGVE
jgi:hypothetical protein